MAVKAFSKKDIKDILYAASVTAVEEEIVQQLCSEHQAYAKRARVAEARIHAALGRCVAWKEERAVPTNIEMARDIGEALTSDRP